MTDLIPASLLTGFLGSGKTTLLNRLLPDPFLADTLVLINEFGEIGLDHQLIASVDAERVVMASGCICCTIQSDLSMTLMEMIDKRAAGTISPFRRVVIETTGLADPAPILHTLMQDPTITPHYRLDGVIATVDLVNADSQLTRQQEAVKQIAVADRLVLTKRDLISDATALTALEARLQAINPAAPRLAVDAPVAELFNAGLYNPASKSMQVQEWLRAEAYARPHHHHDHHHGHDHHHHHDVNRHDDLIRAHCLIINEPLDWGAFSLWAQSLAAYRGEDLLRLKAILHLKGEDVPLAVHGIQHLFHPPAKLPAWPDEDRRSKIVLITRGIERDYLEDTLRRVKLAAAPES